MTNDTWRVVGKILIAGDSIIIRTRDENNAFVNPPGAVAHIAIKDPVTGIYWDWPGIDLIIGSKPELGTGTCEYPINPDHRSGLHTVQIIQDGVDSEIAECDVSEAGKGWRVVFRLVPGEEEPPPPPPPEPEPEPELQERVNIDIYRSETMANLADEMLRKALAESYDARAFLRANGLPEPPNYLNRHAESSVHLLDPNTATVTLGVVPDEPPS